jgi:hypothetical protein
MNKLFSEILDDAEYLIDELNALNQVIKAIPYAESAGNDLAVIDLIGLVDYIQVQYTSLLEENFQNGRTQFGSFSPDRLRIDYAQNLKDKNIDFADIEPILSNCKNNRRILVNLISKYHSQGIDDAIKNSLTDDIMAIVLFERLLFKEIAERVLTIDIQNSYGN